MARAGGKGKDKSVFDVAQPGASPAGPTAKPIITTHGPMLKDPMVDGSSAKEAFAATTPLKVINPADGFAADKPDGSTATAVKTKPVAGDEPVGQAEAFAAAGAAVSAATDQVAESAVAESARQQQIEDLAAAETYFLPIGQVARRRYARVAAVVLAAALVLAAGYGALKAGLL